MNPYEEELAKQGTLIIHRLEWKDTEKFIGDIKKSNEPWYRRFENRRRNKRK